MYTASLFVFPNFVPEFTTVVHRKDTAFAIMESMIEKRHYRCGLMVFEPGPTVGFCFDKYGNLEWQVRKEGSFEPQDE